MTNIHTTTETGRFYAPALIGIAGKIKDGALGGGSFTPSKYDGIKRYIVSVQGMAMLDQADPGLAGGLDRAVRTARLANEQTGVFDHFAGYWVDNGLVHIDVNRSFDTLDEAMTVAMERGELAIFDTLEGEEIRTGLTLDDRAA